MKKSKLLALLSTLTADEFKRFGRFIRSPYYTYNPKLTTLYAYLQKCYPAFEDQKMARDVAFEKIFPGEPFNWNKFKKLMSNLTYLAEEYLVHLELEQEQFEKKKWYAKALGRRGLFDVFERETQHLLNDLEEQPHRSSNYFGRKTELLRMRYFHPEFDRFGKKDETMQELVDSFDAYFGLTKMQYKTEIVNRERIFNRTYEQRFYTGIEAENERGFLAENTAFQSYVRLNLMNQEKEESHFLKLEQHFFAYIGNLARTDQQIIFFSGLNYAIRQMNEGKKKYGSKAFNWYKLGLKYELLIEGETMSEASFMNIVSVSCFEQQFDWAADFIAAYQKFLKVDIREEIVTFNLAYLQLYQHNFDEILQLFSTYRFSIPLQPRVRFMEIRVFFELFLKDDKHFELLSAKTDAALNFYRRNKFLSQKSLEPYRNGVRVIQKLTKMILEQENQKTILNWLRRQKETKAINGIDWLIERFHSGHTTKIKQPRPLSTD